MTKLREGFTTGSCAAACALASCLWQKEGECPAAVEITVKGRSADDLVKKLPQFLSILADCNGPEERV